MDWLEQDIGVHMPVDVEETIHMETVKTIYGEPFGYKIFLWGKFWCTVERGSGTIRGKAAVTGNSATDGLVQF